jgi:hypothetical protein
VASLVDLRERLKRRPGMAGLTDEQADDLLAEAGETVIDYCGWQVWPRATTTVTVDSYGADVVGMPTLMLHAVTSVETRPLYDLETDAWDAVASGWDWSENGLLLRCGCWPAGPRRVRAAMDSGYDGPPGAIGSVLLALAVMNQRVPVGASSEQAGGESISYASSGASTDSGAGGMLTDAERRVLDRYRLDNRP